MKTEQTYYFMRHATAVKGCDDQQRPLSSLGKSKLNHIRKSFYNICFDLIITSSAIRTQQTAALLFPEQHIKTVIAEKLYLPTSIPDQIVIFQDLRSKKNLVPQDVFNSKSETVWMRYATNALTEINDISTNYKAKKTLVVGHGVVINIMGYLLNRSREELMTRYFEPGHGFWA